jgi:putative endonuclease
MEDEWEVYIIQDISGKLYTGITKDLKRRFSEHKSGKKGAKFFSFAAPDKIVFQEKHTCRSSASKKEAAIKKMSRKEKLELIASLDA